MSNALTYVGRSGGLYALQPRTSFTTDPNFESNTGGGDPYDQLEVLAMAFSHDDLLLAVATSTGAIHVHNPDNSQLICVLETENELLPITGLKFRPSIYGGADYVLAASCADGSVTHWHVPSQTVLFRIPPEGENALFTIDYSCDGGVFATAGRDTHIRVYDEATKMLVSKLPAERFAGELVGHTNRIFSVKFHPGSPHILVSGGWDNAVHVWDLRCAAPVRTIYGPHICADSIDIACPSPHADAARLLRASSILKADEFLEGQSHSKSILRSASAVAAAATAELSRSCSSDGTLSSSLKITPRVEAVLELNRAELGDHLLASEILNYSPAEAEAVLNSTSVGRTLQLAGLIPAADGDSDGASLLSRGVTRRTTSTLIRRTTTTRKSIAEEEECVDRAKAADELARKLGVSASDRTSAGSQHSVPVPSSYIFTGSCSASNPAQLWDLGTGKLVGEFDITAKPTQCLDSSQEAKDVDHSSLTAYAACLSPSGGLAAVGGAGSPYAHVFSTQTFECLDLVYTDEKGCYGVRYSPNSKYFVVCGKQPVLSVITCEGIV